MKKILSLPIVIVITLIFGGAGFYGGLLYGKSQGDPRVNFGNLSATERQFFANDQGSARRIMNGGSGFTNGEIIAQDDKSITVKTSGGGSKIIFLADSTKITKAASSSATDLIPGKQVIVTGTTNQDGSITAATIQLGQIMPFGQLRPNAGQPSAPNQ